MTANLKTAKITLTGTTTSRSLDDRHGAIINVKDFGAVGDGTGDDGPEIQAAFDLAFGTAGSPHGNTNRFLNRPVYIPPGVYNIGAPLYLTHVVGGKIFGGGMNSTRLTYTGSDSGNTVVANSISPLIMTNGVSYSSISDMNLAIGNTGNLVGLYLYQNGSKGNTNQNEFHSVLFEGGIAGCLIGYQSNALCSEQSFYSCIATGAGAFGFRNIASNALNNNFYNCSSTQSVVGWSVPTGAVNIYGGGSNGNTTCDFVSGQNPMSIIGFRSESKNFLDATDGSGSPVFVAGCGLADTVQAGYFVNLGSTGRVVMEACTQEDTSADAGLITGTSGSNIYLRGNVFRNTAYKDAFTGTLNAAT